MNILTLKCLWKENYKKTIKLLIWNIKSSSEVLGKSRKQTFIESELVFPGRKKNTRSWNILCTQGFLHYPFSPQTTSGAFDMIFLVIRLRSQWTCLHVFAFRQLNRLFVPGKRPATYRLGSYNLIWKHDRLKMRKIDLSVDFPHFSNYLLLIIQQLSEDSFLWMKT